MKLISVVGLIKLTAQIEDLKDRQTYNIAFFFTGWLKRRAVCRAQREALSVSLDNLTLFTLHHRIRSF